MVIIPLVATVIIGGTFYFLLSAIFSGTEEVGVMNESLLQIQSIIDNTDVNLIPDNIETQNGLMEQLAGKGFHICALQDGKILFTSMDDKEKSLLSEYIAGENLYTANQTLWIPDDDVFLLWRKIETNTLPITFIVLGSNDVDRLGGGGDTAAIISISILVISAIVFIVILFSLYLANRILKKIMIPLDHLCDGAQRIQEGNLDQDIFCQGTEELEKVCDTFNEMQHQLKENAKKNEKYERERNNAMEGSGLGLPVEKEENQ